jgi:hypothetical protein
MKKITLNKDGTFAHFVINGHPPPPGIEVNLEDDVAIKLSQNPQSLKYNFETNTLSDNVINKVFFFADEITAKQNEIDIKSNKALEIITAKYQRWEIDSWPTQEQEAKNWTADNTVVTPLLDSMLSNRVGIDKAELVTRILAKAANFKSYSGLILGKKQSYEDALALLPDTATQADIDQIVVDF